MYSGTDLNFSSLRIKDLCRIDYYSHKSRIKSLMLGYVMYFLKFSVCRVRIDFLVETSTGICNQN